jgi:hypothetical protein
MEAGSLSETLVTTYSTTHHNPEDNNPYSEDLATCMI